MSSRGWPGLLAVGIALLGSACLEAVPNLEDAHIRPAETRSFQRLSEFFTGRENPGNRLILRSRPEQRDGMYLFCRFSDRLSAFPPGVEIHLDILAGDALEPETWRMRLPSEPTRKRRLVIGVTGEDWPDLSVPALAWRLRAVNPDGIVLLEEKSYLWEAP